jgi:hypothetical protein
MVVTAVRPICRASSATSSTKAAARLTVVLTTWRTAVLAVETARLTVLLTVDTVCCTAALTVETALETALVIHPNGLGAG